MSRLTVLAIATAAALLCRAIRADVITTADLPGWRDRLADLAAWQARPDWLPNADPSATVTRDGQVACFRVDAPGRGMKWSRGIHPVSLAETPYLLLRYRATNIKTDGADYLIYADDHVPGKECRPIRFCDVVADGQWRTVAVDMRGLTHGRTVDAVAVQVHAGSAGKARLWIAEIGFAETPPDGAELLRAEGRAKVEPDVAIRLSAAAWTPQKTWLANPTEVASVSPAAPGTPTVFRVDEAGRGMKWFTPLDPPLALAGHRYLAMRYRAVNLGRYHDYALCFVGGTPDGSTYEEVVRGIDLNGDGNSRTVIVSLGAAAARIPKASGMAIQVQAARAPAELHLDVVRLTAGRPSTVVADLMPLQPRGSFDGFRAIDLSGVANQTLEPVLAILRASDWRGERAITAYGVPFQLRQDRPRLAATGVKAQKELTIPVGSRTSQVFLLMLGALKGQDDSVYGGGTFRRIDDVDRFRLRLMYEDGTIDECLPINISTNRFEVIAGVQVLCAFADPDKLLRSVGVLDATDRGGFAVASVTCRSAGPRLFESFAEDEPPRLVRRWEKAPQPGKIRTSVGPAGDVAASNNLLRLVLVTDPSPCIRQLTDNVARRDIIPARTPEPLVTMTVDGHPTEQKDYRRITERTALAGPADKTIVYEVGSCPGLRIQIGLDVTEGGAMRFRGKLINGGQRPYRVGVSYPRIGPYVLGDDLSKNEYVFPCRAPVIGREDVSLSTRYSGMFGVQFMATANPSAGEGLYLRTEDSTCIERSYELRKDAAGLLMSIRYLERPLAPAETRPLADTLIAVGDGDWHVALDDYRRWLKTWYRPASPRKQWFREAFNFRQRFLHWLDPLYDAKTGVIDLPRAVVEARKEFGGIDYLHLFDWGNCGPHGRIYGRIGDYSPYDFIEGGLKNLHEAIAGVRKQGVPVGLYIEGYLLDERGKLGRQHGAEWQLLRPDGTGARWPSSSEIFICADVEGWRKIQAATYAAKVRELDVDGMYIDEYGFTAEDKDCYSAAHGHPVPSYPVVTELETTRAIRSSVDAVKPGVAIYTEESPCDVTSQYQDGSFTYEMNQCHGRRATIPVNLFRFAVPDFKTFEILLCDMPTASWATGVRWTFFNGEGLWLEGPAEEWFAPQTRATIRRCHAILRRHRDAFTTDEPRPLVDTLMGGVLANYFSGEGKEVWTLYNTRHRTARGGVLRVGHRPGWSWFDAWNERAAVVRIEGDQDVVSVEVGPQGVGCLVRSR